MVLLKCGQQRRISWEIDFGSFQDLAIQYDFSGNPRNSELFLARLNERPNPPRHLSFDEEEFYNVEADYIDFFLKIASGFV